MVGRRGWTGVLQRLTGNMMSGPMSERIRVIDLETGGAGPQDVCEIGWQDVIKACGGRWQLSPERGALLINPGRTISPETMAIHHILDDDVAQAPFWKDVASDVLRPSGGVLALAAHRAAFEQRYCTPRLTGNATWICTWKCAMRIWPALSRFSNQMLRYLRMPEGLDHKIGLPAHRALPDAYVTAHHLRDMLNEATVDQLVRWSLEPGLLPRVPSGSHRGKIWAMLPDDILGEFASDRDPDVRFSAQVERVRRGEKGAAELSLPAQGTLL